MFAYNGNTLSVPVNFSSFQPLPLREPPTPRRKAIFLVTWGSNPRRSAQEEESLPCRRRTKNRERQASINIASGLRYRSRKEQLALDNPGHMHEYVFQQTLGDFHWELIESYLDAVKDPFNKSPVLFLAPRNHAKTTLFGESVPLWCIGKDPNTLIQVISSKDTVAKRRVKRVADCIMSSKRYRNLFGNLYPGNDPRYTWSPSGEAIEVKCDRVSSWDREGGVERDPTLSAYGILTSVEGGRAHFQVYDDVVNTKNARSEALRHQIREKYFMSFQPMLLPRGVMVVLGTRYHYEDLYSELIPVYDSEGLYTDLYPKEEVVGKRLSENHSKAGVGAVFG